ncbi:MAG: hypothetical protein AAGG80_05355 [Pseudomonadota bacterium]
MDYDYFIGMIQNYETDRIKAFRGDTHTAFERIPNAFVLLIPEIINLLSKNINKLCQPDQGILIFGLQPAGGMIASDQPIDLKRTIEGYQANYHFCCTLDYIAAPLAELETYKEWHNTQSIVIDFTAGELMDADHYAARLSQQRSQGTILGRINGRALAQVWAIYNLKKGNMQNAKANLGQEKKTQDPIEVEPKKNE